MFRTGTIGAIVFFLSLHAGAQESSFAFSCDSKESIRPEQVEQGLGELSKEKLFAHFNHEIQTGQTIDNGLKIYRELLSRELSLKEKVVVEVMGNSSFLGVPNRFENLPASEVCEFIEAVKKHNP